MARVVLAMSGGVDSSVAAHLLLEQGHEVIGVFMRHGEESPVAQCSITSDSNSLDHNSAGSNSFQLPVISERPDHKQGCCSATDAADARRVADNLDIPFYALNLQQEFNRIIEYFIDEYITGRTPNPCVMCNNWIKFGKLFDYADSVSADYVATGHYARLSETTFENETPKLLLGVDPSKDQTYALFGIQKKYLRRMMLPVGHYQKSTIRELAAKVGLRVADKKDSQEICFVTSGKHDQFIKNKRDDLQTAGNIVTTQGIIVGTHTGIEKYTIGQRKGLGIAHSEPLYVTKIDPEKNEVIVGIKQDLGCKSLTANRTNWLVDLPDHQFACTAKIRYNSHAVPAICRVLENDRIEVEFEEPRFGVAPGQAVVCYEEDQVLGGGWIE